MPPSPLGKTELTQIPSKSFCIGATLTLYDSVVKNKPIRKI